MVRTLKGKGRKRTKSYDVHGKVGLEAKTLLAMAAISLSDYSRFFKRGQVR